METDYFILKAQAQRLKTDVNGIIDSLGRGAEAQNMLSAQAEAMTLRKTVDAQVSHLQTELRDFLSLQSEVHGLSKKSDDLVLGNKTGTLPYDLLVEIFPYVGGLDGLSINKTNGRTTPLLHPVAQVCSH